MQKKITIIIPTFNEAENIKIIVNKINKILSKQKNYEILVIDDNSPDKTYEIAKKLKNTRAICRRNKRGLSSAVIDGFKESKGDYIMVIDADLSHPPKYIPKLLKAIEKNDIVVGSRLVKGGNVEEWPLTRKFMSFGARMLARPLTNVKDTMSGFFVVRKNIIKNVKLAPLGYKILLEVLIKGKAKKITEVPYIFTNREVGESKISGNVMFEYIKQLVGLYKYKIKRK